MRRDEIALAVTTSPRPPADYLSGTLESLKAGGFCPDLIHRDDAKAGSWPSFLTALAALLALRPGAGVYCVAQDDLRVSRGLGAWLAGNLWPFPDVGVASLYSCEADSTDKPAGWHRPDPDKLPSEARGALFLCLPPDVARLLLAGPPFADKKWCTDYHLGYFCRENKLAWCYHVPSFVRHVGEVSACRRTDRSDGRWPLTRWRKEGAFLEEV